MRASTSIRPRAGGGRNTHIVTHPVDDDDDRSAVAALVPRRRLTVETGGGWLFSFRRRVSTSAAGSRSRLIEHPEAAARGELCRRARREEGSCSGSAVAARAARVRGWQPSRLLAGFSVAWARSMSSSAPAGQGRFVKDENGKLVRTNSSVGGGGRGAGVAAGVAARAARHREAARGGFTGWVGWGRG
jgi:hypothetical protein